MQITLPCCQKQITLRSLSRAQVKELIRLEKDRAALVRKSFAGTEEEQQDALARLADDSYIATRETMTAERYADAGLPGFDTMENRDVMKLIDATYLYSLNRPESEIKNLCDAGGGTPTDSAPNTAEPART